jgi:hypothetical protein
MTNDEQANSRESEADILAEAINHVIFDRLIQTRYERLLVASFPNLGGDGDAFNARMDSATEHLGGPPTYYLVKDGGKPPLADSYPEAVLREVMSVFDRARKSVIRAHMCMTGAATIEGSPQAFTLDPKQLVTLGKVATEAFWEHAEAAYIRLTSYWDRVGQVLDFAFFNIRKFDQNGFTAVMDRVATNAVPMNERFKKNGSWTRLRAFQTSEKDDGLKWLLVRRNLIIHSLHLHPLPAENEPVFESQFNHLDSAHRLRQKPRSMREEVEILTRQLQRAVELFDDFLHVVEFSASRRVDPIIHD